MGGAETSLKQSPLPVRARGVDGFGFRWCFGGLGFSNFGFWALGLGSEMT